MFHCIFDITKSQTEFLFAKQWLEKRGVSFRTSGFFVGLSQREMISFDDKCDVEFFDEFKEHFHDTGRVYPEVNVNDPLAMMKISTNAEQEFAVRRQLNIWNGEIGDSKTPWLDEIKQRNREDVIEGHLQVGFG